MKNKIYSQKFFFDIHKTDYVAVNWKTGLQEFFIYHNNMLIQKVRGLTTMKNGVVIEFPEAGNVFVRLVQKPLGFEVKLGNRYLFQSRIIAKEKLTAISQIFTVAGVITIFSNLDFTAITGLFDLLYYIPLLIGVFYIIAAIFIKRGYLALYIIGLVIFTVSTLLTLLILGWSGIIFHVIRTALLILIFSHLKYIVILHKHKNAILVLNKSSTDILDDL